MAKGYRPVARDQQFLLPPDMREWLPADHPGWLGSGGGGGHLDTSGFQAARRAGGAGGAGVETVLAVGRVEVGRRKLAAGAVAAHAAADAAEDEALGPGVRGDEVPAGVASPRSKAAAAGRAARIARALAGLEAGREAAEAERAGQDARARAYLEALAAGAGPPGPPPGRAGGAPPPARLGPARAGPAAQGRRVGG